jgi:RHS repeat-associated protein
MDLSGSFQGAGGIGGLLARTANELLAIGDLGAHAYYHSDGNGNITVLVNTNGLVVARYQYDPYGNLLGISGPLAEANTYRFSSKEWHGNAGLYYYGFRYYEPNLQRWLNRDPIAEDGGLNIFRFVRNDPFQYFDPFGLAEACDQGETWYPNPTGPGMRGEPPRIPPIQIMRNSGGLVNPASGSGNFAAGVGSIASLLDMDYHSETGVGLGYTAWQAVELLFPRPQRPAECADGCPQNQCPGHWSTPAPSPPPLPEPMPPPTFPHAPWNSGSDANSPPVIVIRN